MKQFKKAHLAITTGDTGIYIQVKGDMDGLILAWVLLTTHIAKKMKIPLPKMFALCEALRSGVETLHRSAETCEIDLSGLRKGDALRRSPRGWESPKQQLVPVQHGGAHCCAKLLRRRDFAYDGPRTGQDDAACPAGCNQAGL